MKDRHLKLTVPTGGLWWYGLLLIFKNFVKIRSVLLFPNRSNYQAGLVSKALQWQKRS